MFLGISGSVPLVNDDDLKRLGDLIAARRKAEYGTKFAAYKQAGVNAATWDRAEAGLPIREDRMKEILRALWGVHFSDPEFLLEAVSKSSARPSAPSAKPSLDAGELASWAEENFLRINDTLTQIAEAIEEIKRKVGISDAALAAEKSDDGATVTQLPPRPEPSESDETLNPAANDFDSEVDEEPGGSERS